MRILYVNIDSGNARDKVTIRGLSENGAEIAELAENSKGYRKFFALRKKHLEHKGSYDAIIVGYTGGIFVPFMRLISNKKIIYNALASLYEGMVISRGKSSLFLKAKYYLIDFLAFHIAHHTLVESEPQKNFIAKKFGVRKSKISVHFTGADDDDFYFDPKIEKLPTFTAVFRGKFLPEAGVEVLLHAAKLLEGQDLRIRILGHGMLEKEIRALSEHLSLQNTEIIVSFLSTAELQKNIAECHVSIGQISDHPRLERTIPHKAFEALAMKLPYLTARSKGVLSLLKENETCLCAEGGNAKDLAEKILCLKNDPMLLEKIATSGHKLYLESLTPKILGENLMLTIKKLIQS
ncbi:MAG: glycosyltransferase [Patescibacteria group bacterium]